jgi:diguanylate cyclase (GGDEF)-like protein/PAS domain S-box-containing protein
VTHQKGDTAAPPQRSGPVSDAGTSGRLLGIRTCILLPSLAAVVCGGTVALLRLIFGFRPEPGWLVVAAGVVAGLVVRQAMTLRERAALADELARRESHYLALLSASSDVIAVIGEDGTVSYCSPAIETVLGYEPDYLVGARLIDGVHLEDVNQVLSRFRALIKDETNGSIRFDCRVRHANGEWVTIESRVTDHRLDPSVRGLVFNLRDVSDRTRLEGELTHLAHHDSLTDLPNRALLLDRARRMLATRRSEDVPATIVIVDLDGFKAVNDTGGHALGDAVLQEAGTRLRMLVRAGDTVARLDSDRFAVLLEDHEHSGGAMDVVTRMLGTLAEPYVVDGREYVVGATAGVAFGAAISDCDADTLLVNAELALRAAKSTGRGRFEVFVPEMHEAAVRRTQLEAELRRAISAGEFILEYQPVFDLGSTDIVGAEALVRWNHPTRGVLPPSEFVAAAEESGLIVRLSRWVVEESCRQLARWRRAGFNIGIAVNLSPRQLAAPGLVESVAGALRTTGVPPSALTLEITETALVDSDDRTLAKLHLLRELGVLLAIDDFGTGYSSLSYLHRLPIDVLKIDRSYVSGVGVRAEMTSLTTTIVRLGEELGLTLVAEGIEESDQLAGLAAMGCHLGQGYLFARPLPAECVTAMLHGAVPSASGSVITVG